MVRFGEQRLHDPRRGRLERLVFRVFGVADPAHYLHGRYLRTSLTRHLKTEPLTILDAGCGAGDYSFYLARRFPRASVLGVDLNADLIRRNREMAGRLRITNVHFEAADLATRRWPSRFDLIVSIDVLEHIPEQDSAIRALAEGLSGAGVFFAHMPCARPRPVPFSNHLGEFHRWAEHEHLAGDRTAEEFVEAFRLAGLTPIQIEKTFGYYTGELATSLFALPYSNTPLNRVLQLLVMGPARLLALLDGAPLQATRFAVAIVARQVELS